MPTPTEQPEAQHPVVRHKIDFIVPVAALFVSFVSILIAWYSASIEKQMAHQNERMVQAASLPRLSHSIRTLTDANGGGRITFRTENDGIGPAEIRTSELLLDGNPIRTSTEMLDRFGIPGGQLSVTRLTNLMIRPGEAVDYFDLTSDPSIAPKVIEMIEASQRGRFKVRLCYCSVFDECWMLDGGEHRPSPVEQCPMPPTPYE